MYLKGIEINGFKSFADKIDLEFGQGITAIVGPNGSGKSNVSDAIRWVLGEQSVKSLRGSRMEDIIFAGTQKRQPMGFAQVSITFDNKDGMFNSDAEEIRVTRKLHRSGDSEYRINNAPCRLRDIHELFMDTGLGREGYSVIGQGKIDQILSSKAEERRHIFEEASGITKYKYRKAEAEKKLLAADDNLLRIKDLITALADQVTPLETQSKKARKYLDLREQLKGLDINISIRNIDKQRETLADGQRNFKIAFDQLNCEKEKLASIENGIDTKTTELSRLNEHINSVREKAFAMEKDSGSLESRIEILKNDCKNNEANIERWIAENNSLEERASQCDARIAELKESITAADTGRDNTRQKADELEKKLAGADKRIADRLVETEDMKSEIVSLLGEISSVKAKSSGMDVLLKNFDERRDSLKGDLESKRKKSAEIKANLEKLRKADEDNRTAKKNCAADMDKLKTEYFAVAAKLDSAKRSQNELVTVLNEKRSRMNVLRDLEKGYEGYAKSVKSILNRGMSGVHGVVSKLLTVDDKYMTAVEIALGGALQNIVVENEGVAKECIAYLKANKVGRATFLPLTSVRSEVMKNPPKGERGFLGVASELISCDSRYDGIFKSLLGRTVIADNIDNATDMARRNGFKLRIVTLDGQLLNPGGSMTGGSIGKNQSLLSRARDIELMSAEVEKMQKQADQTDDEIADYKAQINDMADRKQKIEDAMRACEHEQVRLQSLTASDERLLAETERSIELITNERGDIVSEMADIDKQKAVFKGEIVSREEKIKGIRSQLEKLESDGERLAEEREKLVAQITETKIFLASADNEVRMICEKIESSEADKENYLKEHASKLEDIENAKKANDAIQAETESLRERINQAKSGTEDLHRQVDEGQKSYDDGSRRLKEMQHELKSQNAVIYDLQQETVRLESKNAKIESDTEAVIAKLWDDYELTYNTALEFKKTDFNMTEAQREAASLRSQIKALGNINIDSIEQYKEVKERFDYLTEQKKDLDETKKKLEQIIREMQTVMVKQFNESFDIIKRKFNETFAALFGGGVGSLSLSEPDNVLESGIEIEVQPPGKKLQNMMALSGGERALSAIALLFSVLEVRPTPFCILDEVEAALDDNNVYRFADYIRKYSKKTQFIVVTHRRGTMEAADIMYGVTMQEKGISKLLKLKFEDLEEYSADGA